MVPGGKIRDQGRPERERPAEVGEQVPLRPEWRQQTLFAWAAGVGRTALISRYPVGISAAKRAGSPCQVIRP